MPNVYCPCCGDLAEPFKNYHGISDARPLEVRLFRHAGTFRCRACKHGFCHPALSTEELRTYYEQEYESSVALGSNADRGMIRWHRLRPVVSAGIRRLSSILHKRNWDPRSASQLRCLTDLGYQKICSGTAGEGFRSLESGAAEANFSRLLRQDLQSARYQPIENCVVEPRTSWDRSYARSGIQKLGATLESLVSARPFHLMTLSHSLEHLPNLSTAVQRVFQFLQPGGLVFVEVPNCSDEYWKLRFWPDPPHVHFFCRSSASKLFQRNGFEVLFTMTCGPEVAAERYIGYLSADTAQVLKPDELAAVLAQRARRARQHEKEHGIISNGLQSLCTYAEEGRAYLRIVCRKHV